MTKLVLGILTVLILVSGNTISKANSSDSWDMITDNERVELITQMLVVWTKQSVESMKPWGEAITNVCTNQNECELLAAQAFVESRFASWVLDGSCNDENWRADQPGWIRKSCDNGIAFGPWQIHDPGLAGQSPIIHANLAIWYLHNRPYAWTTWKAARAQVQWWHSILARVLATRAYK